MHVDEPHEPVFQSQYATFWIDRGILYCKYADGLHLSLQVARAIVEERIAFSKGRPYPVLVDMKGIKSSTGAARKFMATNGTMMVVAGALITGSRLNKALGNLFLKIDMPPVPTRLFTQEYKAVAWLRTFL